MEVGSYQFKELSEGEYSCALTILFMRRHLIHLVLIEFKLIYCDLVYSIHN